MKRKYRSQKTLFNFPNWRLFNRYKTPNPQCPRCGGYLYDARYTAIGSPINPEETKQFRKYQDICNGLFRCFSCGRVYELERNKLMLYPQREECSNSGKVLIGGTNPPKFCKSNGRSCKYYNDGDGSSLCVPIPGEDGLCKHITNILKKLTERDIKRDKGESYKDVFWSLSKDGKGPRGLFENTDVDNDEANFYYNVLEKEDYVIVDPYRPDNKDSEHEYYEDCSIEDRCDEKFDKRLLKEINNLSPRQRDVLLLIQKNMSNAEIVSELGIHKKSVQMHRDRGIAKLQTKFLGRTVEIDWNPKKLLYKRRLGGPDRFLGWIKVSNLKKGFLCTKCNTVSNHWLIGDKKGTCECDFCFSFFTPRQDTKFYQRPRRNYGVPVGRNYDSFTPDSEIYNRRLIIYLQTKIELYRNIVKDNLPKEELKRILPILENNFYILEQIRRKDNPEKYRREISCDHCDSIILTCTRILRCEEHKEFTARYYQYARKKFLDWLGGPIPTDIIKIESDEADVESEEIEYTEAIEEQKENDGGDEDGIPWDWFPNR